MVIMALQLINIYTFDESKLLLIMQVYYLLDFPHLQFSLS